MGAPRSLAFAFVAAGSILALASGQSFSSFPSRQQSSFLVQQSPQIITSGTGEDFIAQQLSSGFGRPGTFYTEDTYSPSKVPSGFIGASGPQVFVNNPVFSGVQTGTPAIEFLNPKGVRLTVNYNEPYPKTSVYEVRYHVNINKPLVGKRGDWEGTVANPGSQGATWSFTFPDIRLSQGDTIYALVEILGAQGLSRWFREYTRIYQSPDPDPHRSGAYLNPNEIETAQRPQGSVNPPYEENVVTRPLVPGYTPSAAQNPYEPQPQPQPQTPVVQPSYPRPSYERPRPKPSKQPYMPTETKIPVDPPCSSLSSTTYNNGKRPCPGIRFVDHFSFTRQSQITGPDDEDSFTVFLKNRITLNKAGAGDLLVISPTLLEDLYGSGKKDGSLDLTDCTHKVKEYCDYRASGYRIVPPVVSGRVTTESTLHFQYGSLEVSAKMPSGDWIVSELWLMPKNRGYGDNSGKIILARTRGNEQLTGDHLDYSNKVLEMGVEFGPSKQPETFRETSSRPWSDEYHLYKLLWTPDMLIFMVDNREIGRIQPKEEGLNPMLRGSKMAPFDDEFYLVFGVHVAGDKDFQITKDKPWEDYDDKRKLKFWEVRGEWYPTWQRDSSLRIKRIRLESLDS